MSADNWTHCPKCVAGREAKLVAERQRIAALYGKVSVEAFESTRAGLRKLEESHPEQTLREDYEIGIDNCEFSVSYSAGCKCGFRYEFKHSAKVEEL